LIITCKTAIHWRMGEMLHFLPSVTVLHYSVHQQDLHTGQLCIT
jgi:hypothetical protein